jgi:hypothetical protein
MKRLLSVALTVLVTLVGMVGVRSAAGQNESDVITQLQNIQQTFSAVSYAVSALQSTANATNEAVGTLQATVNDGVPASAKKYYLTVNGFTGGDAIKACDRRFHMASLFEIQDPSNLQYVNRSTPVYDSLVDDQGLGPPSNRMGWVRSGVYPPSGFVYDCPDYWDQHDPHTGTTLTLNAHSFYAAPDLPASHPNTWWSAALRPCSQPVLVWCVEDPE